MQASVIKIKKSIVFGALAMFFGALLLLLYINPPLFLIGHPVSVYVIILFLVGMTCASQALFFTLKPRLSTRAARMISLLFLLAGTGAYQLSGYAPNLSCFGKQVYVSTVNAAGGNCTTECTDNDLAPCAGWSSCWNKFVSCDGSDPKKCKGCCFACEVVCEPDPDSPPSITSSASCTQTGDNGWCIGGSVLTLTASDPQNYTLTISGDIGGTPFTCPPGTVCFQPLPQGTGTINYKVDAAQSGMSKSGSTTWKLDATPPSVNGSLTGTAGSNPSTGSGQVSWYLGSVIYNGSASDSLSGVASLTCSLDGSSLGNCGTITITDEGTHTLSFTAKDKAGNTQTFDQTVSIDTQNPTLVASISGTMGSSGWYNQATLTASASDPGAGSGLSALEYRLDGGAWTAFPASGSLDLVEGVHSLEVRASDTAGRTTSSTKSYSLDATLPIVSISPSGTLGSNEWYTSSLNISASASDSVSGMDIFEYSLNGGAWITYSNPLTLSDGTHNLSFWAQDVSGLVTQVDETYKVDTQMPKISGNLIGVPGTNGWYVSDVVVSASATDPAPGSGVEALTYILNGGTGTAYTNPLTLSNGEHTIQFDARDHAGWTDTLTQTIKVDTIAPALNITSSFPSWSKDTITLSGTSKDDGSGLANVEISIDGVNWQPAIGTTAWTYDLDTTSLPSGVYTAHVRTIDNAGLVTEQTLTLGMDNTAPKLVIPDSWFQWDTVTLDAWDSDSGLDSVRIEISDPEDRWPTRKIDLDPNEFPLDFKWDRRFKDGTVAPLGTYKFKVFATDNMGNTSRANATIKILLGILPAGPAATPVPYTRIDTAPVVVSTPQPLATPTATKTPFTSTFGVTPEPFLQKQGQSIVASNLQTPRNAPTKTTVTEWIESIFDPTSNEVTTTETNSSESDPNAFEYATYAAMTAAIAAYTLAEKKRKEEEARRREEAKNARLEKEAKKRAALQKIWDANGAAIYEANQAFKSAHGKEMDAGTKDKAIKDATVNGVFHAGAYSSNLETAKAKQDEVVKAVGGGKPQYMIKAQTKIGNRDEEAWEQWMLSEKGYIPLPSEPGFATATPRSTNSLLTLSVAELAHQRFQVDNTEYYRFGFAENGWDKYDSNCSNFVSQVLWDAGIRFPGSTWNGDAYKRIPASEENYPWFRTPTQQQLFSSYNGEFRIQLNGNVPLKDDTIYNNIIANYPQLFVPGSVVFTSNRIVKKENGKEISNIAPPFSHAAILDIDATLGNPLVVEQDGPADYILNNGAYLATWDPGVNDYFYERNPAPDRKVRLLSDSPTNPIVVNGHPNNLTIDVFTNQISIVPVERINLDTYGISLNSKGNPIMIPNPDGSSKPCYEIESNLLYCLPTVNP